MKIAGDSIFFAMPSFESSFKVRLQADGDISGMYIKGTAAATQYWPLYGYANMDRFSAGLPATSNNISGRWDVSITRANGTVRKAVAVFEQNGNRLTS